MEQLQTCSNASCGRSHLPKEASFCPDCGTPLGKTAQLKIPAGFVCVEGGTFTMGGSESDEKPLHTVTLDTFYMGKYQVTQGEWEEVMGGNPSRFKGKNHPVEQVSWYDAVAFCNALSQKAGYGGCYRIDGNSPLWNGLSSAFRSRMGICGSWGE